MENNDSYVQSVQNIGMRFLSLLKQSNVMSPSYLKEVSMKLESEVIELLHSPKPKIMVYGIYNSGKSTLVNALCRRLVAKVADRPMTDQIAEYDAGKYTLIDSPGVDAPIEHERIADGQLSKCHIILFVINSKGGFESRENYRKMLDIISLGIPFYIVLNDRGTALPKDPVEKQRAQLKHNAELEEIRRKIIENLIQVSGNQHIDQKYEVIVLNAKRAWTGIEKNRLELEEASNVPALSRRINEILDERGALTWLKAPLATLDLCINNAESQVYSLEGHDNYANERQILKAKIAGKINILSDQIRNIVYSRFESVYAFYCGTDNSGLDHIGEEITQEVQATYRREVAPLTQYIQGKFPQLQQMADGSFSCVVKGSGSPVQEKISETAGSSKKGIDFFDIDRDSESSIAADLLGTVGMAALGNAAYDTASTLISSGIGTVASGVAGGAIGTALGGIGSFLPTITPIPGMGALIGVVINAIRKSSKKRQEEEARWQQMQAEVESANQKILEGIAEQARIRQDARTKANALLDEWSHHLCGAVQTQIDATYAAILRALDEDTLRQKEANRKVQQILQDLNALRSELAVLRIQVD